MILGDREPIHGRFDAIVVGGGPAGLSAAYTLGSAGARVAVIERGDWPGSKNLMGGILYSQPTAQGVPEFWNEAPRERPETGRQRELATGESGRRGDDAAADSGAEPGTSRTRSHARA